MADADLKIDLEQLHERIRDGLATAFPDFNTVEFYRDDEDEKMLTPALLLNMSEAEPQQVSDAGAGQFPAMLRFEAYVIFAHNGPATQMAVRKAATSIAAWLYLRRFSPADEIKVIACEPDEFAPHQDRFKTWRIEFTTLVFFGDSAWNNDGTVPESFYSFAPDIGTPNVDQYQPAVPDES
ncbi:hypothetical protein [Bradyrhizobium sp. 613_E4_N2_2]|uniref:hypothetical protein n=1 Tax=Bradyrhizobium sp. 613_E4_N2_2 TaxID=3240371 RepID=UPI003F8A019B